MRFKNEGMSALALECVTLSETGNNQKKWYSLYRSPIGNSGFSFGRIQFDISVSQKGRETLLKCGVPQYVIDILNKETEPVLVQDAVVFTNNILALKSSHEIVDRACAEHVDKGLERIRSLDGTDHVQCSRIAVLFLVDYHTQFHISVGGKLHRWVQGLLPGRMTVEQFMRYKRSLKWASQPGGQQDIDRRYKCLEKFAKQNGLWHDEIDGSDIHVDRDIDSMPEWLRD